MSLLTHSELKPTSMPVYSGGATPSQFSSAYEASAAFVWLGMSISGTIVMCREAAYATMSLYWACV